MQELPLGDADAELVPSSGGGLAPHRPGELAEFDPVVARRNRRSMTLIMIPALLIGAAALVAAFVASHSATGVPVAHVPAGYQSVTDGSFGYAVPKAWSQNTAYTDDVGDLDTSGKTGWAAEHLGVRVTPPAPGEAPPASLATYGEPRSLPYHLTAAQAISVPGASTAFRYQMTRDGGFDATVIDAWQSRSGAEIWLVIKSDPATTATIAASLKG